jgi:hypothetical protein
VRCLTRSWRPDRAKRKHASLKPVCNRPRTGYAENIRDALASRPAVASPRTRPDRRGGAAVQAEMQSVGTARARWPIDHVGALDDGPLYIASRSACACRFHARESLDVTTTNASCSRHREEKPQSSVRDGSGPTPRTASGLPRPGCAFVAGGHEPKQQLRTGSDPGQQSQARRSESARCTVDARSITLRTVLSAKPAQG